MLRYDDRSVLAAEKRHDALKCLYHLRVPNTKNPLNWINDYGPEVENRQPGRAGVGLLLFLLHTCTSPLATLGFLGHLN